MKSERRHELQHNALADWLAQTILAIQPYQNIILTAVTAVVVVMLGYTWWSHQAAAQSTQAWDDMNVVLESGNVPKLTKIIDEYPDTNVAQMAAVVSADYYLGQGCERLFVNKASAQDELNKAIKLYESVRQGSRVPEMIQERAAFGLARAKEAKGELASAERLYEEVVTTWPRGAFASAASQRAIDLKRPATKRLYDDFRNFEPKPVFSGTPGERPAFDFDSLPKEGPIDLPETTFDASVGGKAKEKGKAAEKKDSPAAGKK
jgi:hypothetical protein